VEFFDDRRELNVPVPFCHARARAYGAIERPPGGGIPVVDRMGWLLAKLPSDRAEPVYGLPDQQGEECRAKYRASRFTTGAALASSLGSGRVIEFST
jgi:hypothetical protein